MPFAPAVGPSSPVDTVIPQSAVPQRSFFDEPWRESADAEANQSWFRALVQDLSLTEPARHQTDLAIQRRSSLCEPNVTTCNHPWGKDSANPVCSTPLLPAFLGGPHLCCRCVQLGHAEGP